MLGTIYRFFWKFHNNKQCLKLRSCGKSFITGRGLIIQGPQYISVGEYFSAGRNLSLATYRSYNGDDTGYIPSLIIGNNVSIMDNCAISCINKITIGDGTLLGANVFITDNFHGTGSKNELDSPPRSRKLYSKGPVNIGRNVWIGRNVCVMPGVTIGDGAVIGANAVVTKSVPSKCTVAGVPAAIIYKQEQ